MEQDNDNDQDASQDNKVAEVAAEYKTGENTRVLANGAVYDMDTKRIVANPGGGSTAITQESASDMHEKYRQKRIELGRKSISEGSKAANWEDGVVIMGVSQVEEAIQGKGIAKVKAFETMMRFVDLWPSRDTADAGGGAGLTVSERSVSDLRAIIELMKEDK